MQPESTPAIAPEALEKKRSRRLLLLGVACLLAALAYGIYWLLVARYKVDTDNAYVQGNVVQITPQVGGTIIAIDADDTDSVKLGQTLVRLDTKDARVALEQAEAQLGQTVREVRATFANNKALLATVDARAATLARSQSELNRLSADLARRTPLVGSGAVSKEEVQHLQTAVANARSEQVAAQASLAEAREQLARNQTLTDGTSVENHPRVLAAAGKYREAFLNYQRLTIVAPVAGTVARRSVQIGQRVAAGMPLMAIVPLDNLWVDANFKESQLENLKIGQPARLTADVYGHRTEYKGVIAGLGAGTGAAFSLLPAQNATGNWIKVVQRIPVRIALDPKEFESYPLRVGLSMEVTVDIHDQSGQAVTEAAHARLPNTTDVFDDLDKAADARVDAIVSANLGHPVSLKRAS